MSAERPLALRLAGALGRSHAEHDLFRDSGVELRRLHAEVERLREHAVILAETARQVERERCMSAAKRAIMGAPTAHLLSRDILFANIHAALTPNAKANRLP